MTSVDPPPRALDSVRGARPPLLDRLAEAGRSGDGGPGASSPHGRRMLDRDGVEASVRRELHRLLETRLTIPADELARRTAGVGRTTLDYGVPDAVQVGPRDALGLAAVAAAFREAIAAFEPRLRVVRVRAEPAARPEGPPTFVIAAELRLADVTVPVTFALRRGETRDVAAPHPPAAPPPPA